MSVLNVAHIPKIPILTRQKNNFADNNTHSFSEKSNDNTFKEIFKNQFDTNDAPKSTKLQKIKERIANNYYVKTNITEIIAEKLMNGWA